MNGDIQLTWDVLQPLIITGVTIGIVIAVVAGSIRIGWKYAPYIIAVALIIWFYGSA